ncbi:MAG: hypothetical protein NZR01_17115 [Bryobacteraceae bacterium]|nr:hypothetical protein [Bryobacteraceae bacterium]
MHLTRRIEVDGRAVDCVLPHPLAAAEGKFVVGLREDGGRLAVVFDPSQVLHSLIGERHRLRVLGGGWLAVDPALRSVVIWGESGQFGREPDRRLTVRVLEAALAGYTVKEAG